MKKKLLSLAIAAAMAPGFAAAVDVSGFTDIIYVVSDDASSTTVGGINGTEGKFIADGEVDFSASPADGVTVRVDVDLSLAPDVAGLGDAGANIEQAFFAWGVTEGVTVIGGVFNNPIGHEAEDAPDMNFTTHGQIYKLLDDQTALDGDNVAGLAVAGAIGPVTVTAAFLNDLQESNEENSMALLVNGSPMKGLDLELGFATQADQAKSSGVSPITGTSVEDVTNFNVSYSPAQVAGLNVGLDYATFGKVIDSSYDFWAGYSFGKFGAKIRLSSTELDSAAGNGKWDSTSLYFSYQAASNLSIALEQRNDENDSNWTGGAATDNDVTMLELIAKF